MAEILEVFIIKISINEKMLKNNKIGYEAVTIMKGKRLSKGHAH